MRVSQRLSSVCRDACLSQRLSSVCRDACAVVRSSTVYMHPFSPENFDRLIIRPESGVRTVMVFVDEASRDILIKRFAHAVFPYSKYGSPFCNVHKV